MRFPIAHMDKQNYHKITIWMEATEQKLLGAAKTLIYPAIFSLFLGQSRIQQEMAAADCYRLDPTQSC